MKSVILLVEDFEYDAIEAEAALRRARLANHIEVVRSGEEALDYLKRCETSPDLILVDLGLPVMDGITLIHQVRGDARMSQTLIVILTGRESDEQVFAAMGADAYLTKPLDVMLLMDKLRPFGWSGADVG
jgi:DNA-binding response OmpR family regulator